MAVPFYALLFFHLVLFVWFALWHAIFFVAFSCETQLEILLLLPGRMIFPLM